MYLQNNLENQVLSWGFLDSLEFQVKHGKASSPLLCVLTCPHAQVLFAPYKWPPWAHWQGSLPLDTWTQGRGWCRCWRWTQAMWVGISGPKYPEYGLERCSGFRRPHILDPRELLVCKKQHSWRRVRVQAFQAQGLGQGPCMTCPRKILPLCASVSLRVTNSSRFAWDLPSFSTKSPASQENPSVPEKLRQLVAFTSSS